MAGRIDILPNRRSRLHRFGLVLSHDARQTRFILYILVFIGTCIWSFAEVGTDLWQHVPRLFGPALIAAITTIYWLSAQTRKPTLAWAATIVTICAIAGFFFGITRMPEVSGGSLSEPVQAASAEDWTAFGRTQLGARFAPASQIIPDNVGSLEVAWSIRTGDLPANYPDSYAVPVLAIALFPSQQETCPLQAENITRWLPCR